MALVESKKRIIKAIFSHLASVSMFLLMTLQHRLPSSRGQCKVQQRVATLHTNPYTHENMQRIMCCITFEWPQLNFVRAMLMKQSVIDAK